MSEHVHRIRVRYAETDAQGVAHHAAYVAWLEEARIELLRAHGHSYRALEEGGILMPVVELQLRYQRPLRFDDVAEIATAAEAVGRTRVRFASRIARGGEPIADAIVTVACVAADGRPCRLPEALQRLLAPQSSERT